MKIIYLLKKTKTILKARKMLITWQKLDADASEFCLNLAWEGISNPTS